MFDKYNRSIHYLRISVTDRCNLRCHYCMPDRGVEWLDHKQILSFEEIVEVVKVAVNLGIDKVRITGGEPLVRKGIVDLVSQLARVDGVCDLAMTTNGLLLGQYAQPLAEAGLKRINVSLDTLNPHKFHYLTRNGDLHLVLSGIAAAQKSGLHPIKVNCVVPNNPNEPDAREVAAFCHANHLEVRFIRQMDLQTGIFYTFDGGTGGNCNLCNRLRLTASGKIRPCLFNDAEFDIRQMGAESALLAAVGNKPACGTATHSGNFYNIGG